MRETEQKRKKEAPHPSEGGAQEESLTHPPPTRPGSPPVSPSRD